jgi:hypothetical protein
VRSSRIVLLVFVASAVSLWLVVSNVVRTTAGAKTSGSATAVGPSGLTLGPLLIPAFSRSDVAQVHFKPGYPTKVLLIPTRRWTGKLVLRGARASDGRILRFAYQDHRLPRPPYPAEDMGRLGTAVVRLRPPPSPLPPIGQWGYTGYMLFPDAGDWRIQARRDGRRVGAIVVAVTPYDD